MPSEGLQIAIYTEKKNGKGDITRLSIPSYDNHNIRIFELDEKSGLYFDRYEKDGENRVYYSELEVLKTADDFIKKVSGKTDLTLEIVLNGKDKIKTDFITQKIESLEEKLVGKKALKLIEKAIDGLSQPEELERGHGAINSAEKESLERVAAQIGLNLVFNDNKNPVDKDTVEIRRNDQLIKIKTTEIYLR